MDAAERRLAAVRDALSQLGEKLGGIAIQLWDGSTVPENSEGLLRIALADEAVIAALLKRPSFDTIVRLYALGRVDLAGGNFFAFAARRPILKPKELVGTIGATRLARVGAQFLTIPPGPLQLPSETVTEDLPASFYALFLDPELVFSCAYFETWETDLAVAQRAQLDQICRKLRLSAGDRLLDVGCGWGALICHAAANYDVTAHGLTTSPAQFAYVQEKIAAAGLGERVSVSLEDWSAAQGPYDKIASIGAFEQVALQQHAEYFEHMRSMLRAGGLYLHQAITRRGRGDMQSFRQHKPEYRALLEHVFPGAEVDHLGSTITELESSRFEVHDIEGMREHFARTTEIWCRRLMSAREKAIAEIGRERTRLWIAYLAGASLAFRRGSIGVYQTLASARTSAPLSLPPTRSDLYPPPPFG